MLTQSFGIKYSELWNKCRMCKPQTETDNRQLFTDEMLHKDVKGFLFKSNSSLEIVSGTLLMNKKRYLSL